MNKDNWILKAQEMSTRTTTYIAYNLQFAVLIAVFICSIFSIGGAGYGAYKQFSLHFDSVIIVWFLSLLLATLAELVAMYFFYIGLTALFSKKWVLGAVIVLIGLTSYYEVTYRYTSKGFGSVAQNNDNSEKINLTYYTAKDSLIKGFDIQIDSLKDVKQVYYVKLDSVMKVNGSNFYIAQYRMSASTLESEITGIAANKRDRLNELEHIYKADFETNKESLTELKTDNYNLALITLIGQPVLISLYCFLAFLTALDSKNIITQVISYDKNTQEVVIVDKKKV